MIRHRAYAKINLGLRILRKREDGFHDIETILHPIDLFDEIELHPSDSIEVRCTDPTIPTDESNTCFKAVQFLREHLGVRQGALISITKNIPSGAGLGGGSSDAATVLKYLPSLWKQSVDDLALSTIACKIGLDVPFFLKHGSALALGRGEILEYFSFDLPFGILVCSPPLHIPTSWAYQNHRARAFERTDLRAALFDGVNNPATLRSSLRNDFEELVFGTHPRIQEIKESLLRAGAVYASLSGSGSAVFGFFDRRETALPAEAELRRKGCTMFWTEPHFVPPAV
jgi:4-diphosphocytidyl-2-C-methyl-D-erythritol kinase